MKRPDRCSVAVEFSPAKPTRWIPTTVAALPPLAPSVADGSQVEWLVHDVILCRRLPCTLLSVSPSATGWNVMMRAGARGMVRFTVARGRPAAVRAAIQEALEDAC